jgi:hypothetical protein
VTAKTDPSSLYAALSAAAGELSDVREMTTDSITEWSVGGHVFAAITAGAAEFALDPAVAGAARATPATGPSPRGADWVAFSPPELDRFARDRAIAWLGSAYRRASSPRR